IREGRLMDVFLRTVGPAVRRVPDPGTRVQIPVLVGYAVTAYAPIELRIDRPHDTGVEVLTFPNLTRVGGRDLRGGLERRAIPGGAVHRQRQPRRVDPEEIDQIERRLMEAAAGEVV